MKTGDTRERARHVLQPDAATRHDRAELRAVATTTTTWSAPPMVGAADRLRRGKRLVRQPAVIGRAMKLIFNLPHMLPPQGDHATVAPGGDGCRSNPHCQFADRLSFDMMAVPEHLVIPNEHVELSGPHYLQSTVAQAYIAGATERMHINSCVTVLPLQHPIVLAKALSTADSMSSGRMMVTFGVGWLERNSSCSVSPSMNAVASPTNTSPPSSHCGPASRHASTASMCPSATSSSNPSQSKSRTAHLDRWDATRFAARRDERVRILVVSDAAENARRTHRLHQESAVLRRSAVRHRARHCELPHRRGPCVRTFTTRTEHERRGNRRPAELACGARCDGQRRPLPAVNGVDAYLDYAQWVIEEIKLQLP